MPKASSPPRRLPGRRRPPEPAVARVASRTRSSTTCPSDPDPEPNPNDPRGAEPRVEENLNAADPIQETRRLLPRPTPPQGLRVLRRQDGVDRLQGGQPPPPLPLGAGEDRAAPQDRHLRRAPARAGGGPEAGARRRPAPVRAAAPPAIGPTAGGPPRRCCRPSP